MKIISKLVQLENGDYLVTVDYEDNSLGSGKSVKDTIMSLEDLYNFYLDTRGVNSKYEGDTHKCYCGHTQYCDCSDLDIEMFKDHIKNGNIDFNENNGWKPLEDN